MSLFENYKRKTKEIEIKGCPLVLTEPSAYALTEYYEQCNPLHEQVDAARQAENQFKVNLLNTEINLRLVAICLVHSAGVSADEVYNELRDVITESDEMLGLIDIATELCGLKQLESDSQDESLQEG